MNFIIFECIVLCIVLIICSFATLCVVTTIIGRSIWNFLKHVIKQIKIYMCIKKTQQSLILNIKINTIEVEKDKKKIRKYSLQTINEDDIKNILYTIVESTRKSSINIYVEANISENDMQIAEHHRLYIPKDILINWLSSISMIQEGISLHCTKTIIDTKNRTDFYIVYHLDYSKPSKKDVRSFEIRAFQGIQNQYLKSEIEDLEKDGLIVIQKEKDKDTVVQNYLQSIINKADLHPQKLKIQSPSEIKHSNNKYPEIKQTITDIQMKVESGFQINGLSLNQWDICRTEIEKILQRQLSKKQQKRIKILLERIKSSLYSKKQDDENIDSETTLVALEQLVIVNIEDK